MQWRRYSGTLGFNGREWVVAKFSIFQKNRQKKDSSRAVIQQMKQNVAMPATKLRMEHILITKPRRSSEISLAYSHKSSSLNYNETRKWEVNLGHWLDLSKLKGETHKGKQNPLQKNLKYSLKKLIFIFLSLEIKVFFFQTSEMSIFSTYSPKRNLQCHILRK